MKRIIIVLLALLLLAACQPTPEEDAVKQKNTNVLIDTVQAEDHGQGEDTPAAPPVKEQFPERFQCDFTTNDGAQIRGDVRLRVLTDGTFPVLRVERRTLTNRERLTIAARLLGTEDLYLYQPVLSRKSVEDMIRGLLEEPSFEEYRRDYAFSGATKEDYDAFISYRREQLAYWQAYYLEIPTDGSAVPLKKWDGSAPEKDPGYQTIVTESEGRTNIAFLPSAMVFSENKGEQIRYDNPQSDRRKSADWFGFNLTDKPGVERIDPDAYDVVHDGASVTPRAAAASVLSLFDGLIDLVVDDIFWSNNADTDGEARGEVGTYGYLLRLTPVYDGAALPYVNMFGIDKTREERADDYAPDWDYECVIAAVSPDGVLLSLNWRGSAKVTETVAKTTTLLSYEEISDIFRQQMNRCLYGEGAEMTVTAVKLGLFRIREQNSMETGLLVPAWVFTGRLTTSDGAQNEYSPLLVVNAIDGTIIDAGKGY